jgi:hypothetical protein
VNICIHCPACGEPDVVSVEALGKLARCNRCRQKFRIAADPPPDDDSSPFSPFERRLLFGGLGAAVIIAVILSLILFRPNRSTEPVSAEPSHPSAAIISPDVTYSPIDVKSEAPFKRHIDIALSRKVNKDDLATIAERIRSSYPSDCERTFIFYFLPGTTAGRDECWATTHFYPDLKVVINYGSTASEEKRLVAEPVEEVGDTIGQWLDTEHSAGACRIRIYTRGNETFRERKFADGSHGIQQLIESPSPDGRRFIVSGESFGDYMLIDRGGTLQFRDAEGLIYTLAPSR